MLHPLLCLSCFEKGAFQKERCILKQEGKSSHDRGLTGCLSLFGASPFSAQLYALNKLGRIGEMTRRAFDKEERVAMQEIGFETGMKYVRVTLVLTEEEEKLLERRFYGEIREEEYIRKALELSYL